MVRELVSCIIPVHNRAAFLKASLESVLAQDYRPVEVIIVDDGSDGESARDLDALAALHPDMVTVLHQENAGPGMAREAGRLRARGEFIQYLDSDDLLLPNKFTDQVKALTLHPECDIAYGYTNLIDECGVVLAEKYKDSGVDHAQLFPRLLNLRWWNTHTPLYRKSVCDRMGPWPDMRMGEDWCYESRAAALGVKLVNCHSFVSLTRQHSGERLTGRGLTASVMKDIAKLIPQLYQSALQSGFKFEPKEWSLFYRWTFLEVRRTSGLGLEEEAKRLLEVLESSPFRVLNLKITGYTWMKKVFGARASNQFFDLGAKFKGLMLKGRDWVLSGAGLPTGDKNDDR